MTNFCDAWGVHPKWCVHHVHIIPCRPDRRMAYLPRVCQGTPLPGGYGKGDSLFYYGPTEVLLNGDKVVHGEIAEVMGPVTGEKMAGKGLAMKFEGNSRAVGCLISNLGRVRPVRL
jgi:hypothetical protein